MNVKSRFLLLISAFLLVQVHLMAVTSDNVQGVYLYSSTLSSQGIDVVTNKLKANSVNQVYLLVKGTSGVLTDSTLIADFITAAHNAGIEVHFWYGISQDVAFMTSHPDAVVYHCPKPGTNDNKPYPMTNDANGRMNFLYPGYKEYVLGNIEWLLKNFNCDGIHLDNIRYHHLVYSFDQYHIDRAKSIGCNTDSLLALFISNYSTYSGAGWIASYNSGDPNIVKWVNMRKDIVNEYILGVKNLIQQNKPAIELSASFTPELNNDAMVHYSQDYTICSPNLDRIMPSAFVIDYGGTPAWIKTVTEGALALVSTNCKISTGIQTSTTPATQVEQGIMSAVEGGSCGVVCNRFENTSDEQWAVIKNLYATVLPVELTSMTAEVNSDNVTLKWSTATETNNKGFEIERKSTNNTYTAIGFVDGKGTSTQAQRYSFIDKGLANGKYVYRLKQIDYDGSYTYSQEVETEVSKITTFSLSQNYPNPFNPVTTIKFSVPLKSAVSLKVYNTLGQVVLSLINNETMESGTHSITVDASNLSSGTYIYKLNAGNNVLSRKMTLVK